MVECSVHRDIYQRCHLVQLRRSVGVVRDVVVVFEDVVSVWGTSSELEKE